MYVPLRSKITRCDDSVSDHSPLVPCRAPQHARPRARLWFAPVRGLTLLCWLLFLSSSVPAAGLADNGSPDFTADQAALPEAADNAPGNGEAEAGNGANGNMPSPAPVPGQQGVDRDGRPAWTQLEPGLAFGEFQLNDSEARLTALRIDPARFDFILCASSQDGRPARALSDWGEQYDLTAAINASMYLPDGSTSTGYMRQGGHINNKRLRAALSTPFPPWPRTATAKFSSCTAANPWRPTPLPSSSCTCRWTCAPSCMWKAGPRPACWCVPPRSGVSWPDATPSLFW